MKTLNVAILAAGCALTSSMVLAEPLSTSFSHQGQLAVHGAPLNGAADFQFTLHDALIDGAQVGPLLTFTNHPVVDGVFSLELDFGVDVFNGEARWLKMSVRAPHDPTDTAAYTALAPRQPITATPYALQTRGLFVDEEGNTKVGPVSPGPGPVPLFSAVTDEPGKPGVLGESTARAGAAEGVKGKTASVAGKGVVGEAVATSGPARGVEGKSHSAAGEGVFGEGRSPTGLARGVRGCTLSSGGEGVFGEATAVTGATKGVYGKVVSMSGEGIVGEATATSGPTKGVRGSVASTDGEGVRGEATAVSGAATGVCGVSASTAGTGIVGEATAGSGSTKGVLGMSASTAGEGVRGEATASTGAATGVCGVSASTAGTGIVGAASAGTGATKGVLGMSASSAGEGVRGEATSSTGAATGVCGVSASTGGTGIVGHASSPSGTTLGVSGSSASTSGIGVLGQAASYGGTGVWGNAGIGVRGVGAVGVMGEGNSWVVGAGPQAGLGGTGVYGVSSVSTMPGACPGAVPEPGGAGVFGEHIANCGNAIGVRGLSHSEDPSGAGVLAEGNGMQGAANEPAAAALEVRNGAIRVSGQHRPAGTIALSAPLSQPMQSSTFNCGGCPNHSHVVGHYRDVVLENPLIVGDSIILLTVSTMPTPPGNVYSAQVVDQSATGGSAFIRVSRVGSAADPVAEDITVHYLIINPADPQ